MSPEEKNRQEMRPEGERSGKTQYEMTCEQAAEFVSALYDGERISLDVAAHIGVCTTCRASLREYAEMGAELRQNSRWSSPLRSVSHRDSTLTWDPDRGVSGVDNRCSPMRV